MISNIYKRGRYRPSKEFLRQQAALKKKRTKPFKKGYIYFIYCSASEAIKIGYTKDIKKRMASLQTGSATELILVGYIYALATYEKTLHERYKQYHMRGEWFKADPDLAYELNKTAILYKGEFNAELLPFDLPKEPNFKP